MFEETNEALRSRLREQLAKQLQRSTKSTDGFRKLAFALGPGPSVSHNHHQSVSLGESRNQNTSINLPSAEAKPTGGPKRSSTGEAATQKRNMKTLNTTNYKI